MSQLIGKVVQELNYFIELHKKYFFKPRTTLIVLLLNLVAISIFLPPTEWFTNSPLRHIDYPVHTYRAEIFEKSFWSSGYYWGYDPEVGAGTILHPAHVIGAQIFGFINILLPFLGSSQVMRLSILAVVLLMPLLLLYSAILLGIKEKYHFGILISLLIPFWFVRRIFGPVIWGLIAFLLSSCLALLVFALVIKYCKEKSTRWYFYLVLAGSLCFLAHPIGIFIYLPFFVLVAISNLYYNYKTALSLIALPFIVALFNIFWFYPYLKASFFMPHYSQPLPAFPPGSETHLTYGSFQDLLDRLLDSGNLVMLVSSMSIFAVGLYYLYVKEDKKLVAPLLFTVLFGWIVFYFGSFVPGISSFQPVRYLTTIVIVMSIPMGVAFHEILNLIKLNKPITHYALIGLVIICAMVMGRPWKLPLKKSVKLVGYINEHTEPDMRIAIQSQDGYLNGDYDTVILPMVSDAHVIGSNFPHINEPPQFLSTMFMGKEIDEWNTDDLLKTLYRWDISQVYTRLDNAHALFERALGVPVDTVGSYRIFRVSNQQNRFLYGNGQIRVDINQIVVREPVQEEGLLVLKYRYHPGWEADSGVEVVRYNVPEDPAGFIGLLYTEPLNSISLKFNPGKMLNDKWPSYYN